MKSEKKCHFSCHGHSQQVYQCADTLLISMCPSPFPAFWTGCSPLHREALRGGGCARGSCIYSSQTMLLCLLLTQRDETMRKTNLKSR